jgi:hypothetical protein
MQFPAPRYVGAGEMTLPEYMTVPFFSSFPQASMSNRDIKHTSSDQWAFCLYFRKADLPRSPVAPRSGRRSGPGHGEPSRSVDRALPSLAHGRDRWRD